MKSTARNSFVSMISCRARKSVARIQSDSPEFGQIAAQLDRGQVVWMTPSGEIKRIAVPNTTARHLEAVKNVISATKDAGGSWSATGVNVASNVASTPMLSDSMDTRRTQGGHKAAAEADTNTDAIIIDENAQRALAMFSSGHDIPDIIQEVWHLSSSAGRPYRTVSKQFQAILRSQIGGAR